MMCNCALYKNSLQYSEQLLQHIGKKQVQLNIHVQYFLQTQLHDDGSLFEFEGSHQVDRIFS